MTKTCRFAILLACGLPGFSFAAERPSEVQSDYSRAVAAYVTAAGDQLKAIRTELDAFVANAADETKKRVEETGVYAKLEECDRLIDQLKASDSSTFDKIKAQFEKSRAEMVKRLEKARSS